LNAKRFYLLLYSIAFRKPFTITPRYALGKFFSLSRGIWDVCYRWGVGVAIYRRKLPRVLHYPWINPGIWEFIDFG